MTVLVGEAHDLVLDRGAITGTATMNLTRIHGRAIEVGANEIVNRLIGVRYVALHLWLCDALGGEAERSGIVVSGLAFGLAEINRAAIEPAWCAGLETGQLKAAAGEAIAKRFGRAVAGTATARLGLAGVHDGLEKRTRCENDRFRSIQGV